MSKLALVFLICPCVITAWAQTPQTPEPGSPERKAIMDAMRKPCQQIVGFRVVFKVSHLKVLNGWAFSTGVPLNSDGTPIDWRKTRFRRQFESDAFDEGYCALLRKTGGTWKVKRFLIGHTDVPWVEWPKEFGAPKKIFP